jgi:tetratricopeptide (TPR) repeat protein
MRTLLKIVFLFYCMLLLPGISAASSARDVKEGNTLYSQEKYGEAAEKYNQAKEESPDSDIINFNLGAALYKQGKYKEAIDATTRALSTEDKVLEAKAIYNLANSKYRLGEETAKSDLNSAVSLYRDALDYYKRAIELNEGDNAARYNHELVERELKVLLDQMKNQKQNQDQNQDKNHDQDGEDQQEQQQSQSESDQQKDGEEKDSQQQAGQEDDKQDAAGSDQSSPKKDSAEPQPSEAAGDELKGMSPEEARMLLDAYGQEEALKEGKTKKGYSGGVLKDW